MKEILMKKKPIISLGILIALLIISIICAYVFFPPDNAYLGTVIVEGKSFEYRMMTKEHNLYIKVDGKVTEVRDVPKSFYLENASIDNYDKSIKIDGHITDKKQVATLCAEILCSTYDDWTQKGIALFYNEKEDLWIACGEIMSTDSANNGQIGIIVLDNSIGELICLRLFKFNN